MWSLPAVSPYPVLLHADFIWGTGESHFEPHYFRVEAYRYDPALDRYTKVFTYQTAHKYDGGDARRVRVLVPERAEILRRMAGVAKP